MENRFIRAEDVAQELNVSKPYENPSCKGQRAIGVELCKIGNGDVERTARTSA